MPRGDPNKKDSSRWIVDSSIWSTPTRPREPLFIRVLRKVWQPFGSLFLWTVVLLGPLIVFITFGLAYLVAGPSYTGPVLIFIWSLILAGIIFIIEKTGNARNFEKMDFQLSLSRLGGLTLAFLVVLALAYVIIYVLKL